MRRLSYIYLCRLLRQGCLRTEREQTNSSWSRFMYPMWNLRRTLPAQSNNPREIVRAPYACNRNGSCLIKKSDCLLLQTLDLMMMQKCVWSQAVRVTRISWSAKSSKPLWRTSLRKKLHQSTLGTIQVQLLHTRWVCYTRIANKSG